MFRKNQSEYYTFPGGGVEEAETNEEAIIREIYEEASLKIEVNRLIYQLNHDNGDTHYYFLCHYMSGTPELQPGTNEYKDNQLGVDVHIPQWLPLNEVSRVTLYPIEVRDRLAQDLNIGFSDSVQMFNLVAV